MPKIKRERSQNWRDKDKQLLQRLIKKSLDIIENKNTDTKTNTKKDQAWKTILNVFNNMAYIKRTLPQIKSQWRILRSDKVKKYSIREGEIIEGDMWDGPPPPVLPDNNESHDHGNIDGDVQSWLQFEFTEGQSDYDSDALNKPTSVAKEKNLEDKVLANEIRCRNELHSFQIENEKIKRENLLLEQQYIKEKFKKILGKRKKNKSTCNSE